MPLLIFCTLLFGSCRKDQSGIALSIHQLEVENDSSSALSARIIVHLNARGDLIAKYRIKDEQEERYSNLSVDKKSHSLALLQLKEDTSYEVEIISIGSSDQLAQTLEIIHFTTASIPDWVKEFYDEEENRLNETLGGYYLFASMSSPGCIYIVDKKGELVWYSITPNVVKSVKLTKDNTILSLQDENGTSFGDGNIVLETTLGGDTLFNLKLGEKGFDQWAHHDLTTNNRNSKVAITSIYKDGKLGDGLVEWSSSGAKLWEWSTFDVANEIDPELKEQPWINSIDIDEDGHYILSLRAIHQIWKVHSKNGSVLWKLGKRGNVKMDKHAEFLYQHYAYRNSDGDIMLFDNGHADRPLTRVLSFRVDEQNLSAETILDIELPVEYYSPIMGSAILLPDGNILTASSVTGTALKIDPVGTVIWKLKTGGTIYRIEYAKNPFKVK